MFRKQVQDELDLQVNAILGAQKEIMALLNSVNAGSFVSGVLEASAAEGNSY
jgi:hypothetical protein